jgi:hypothetical protein
MSRIFLFYTFLIISSNFANANITIQNGLSHHYKTSKGSVHKGEIEIYNAGDRQRSVKLFLQDLSYDYNGSIHYKEANSHPFSNANWIGISKSIVDIGKKETVTVDYEITVPDVITEAGSYWSTIIVEPLDDIISQSSEESGIQIRSIIRYAIQIVTDHDVSQEPIPRNEPSFKMKTSSLN